MEYVPYAAFTNGEVSKPPAAVPDLNYSPQARSTIRVIKKTFYYNC